MILDDLQWSDEATLELLAALGPMLEEMPVLAIAAYRSDGLPRDHMLRWLRNELRRGGGLDELVLAPLDRAETAQLLAAPARPSVARPGARASRSDPGSPVLRGRAGSPCWPGACRRDRTASSWAAMPRFPYPTPCGRRADGRLPALGAGP